MKPRHLLPHPLLSLCLMVVWMLLANDLSVGNWVLGCILGWLIPLITQVFWITPPRIYKPFKLCWFFLRIIGDIIMANLQVAKLILGPQSKLRPAFVEIPMLLEDDLALTMLASIISLTPGTVSADLSDDRKMLLVHTLDVGDEAQLVAEIKNRYEAPLLEVFTCSTT
ncbi:Na+/H+ antiporter subunit E [Pseudomonas sp. EL_65y_Pfl2_R95]|uniref:Na+/H+ antiporter subunit E n=1 Tax=Pseudomonas sp. EL_65y_Pfl2_R95 TaxID=3088698 RepID=UPI0030D89300